MILAEELIVNGRVLASAGDIASGQVRQDSRAEIPGEAIDILLQQVTLRAGNVDVPLHGSEARDGVDRLQYRQLPESGKIDLTLFVAEDVEFPENQ